MLLHPNEGFKIILENNVDIIKENIPVNKGLGRVIAENVTSMIDSPPFNKSAMDGYAYNKDDVSDRYKIIEVIPAGSVHKKSVGKGECSKIMTGAMIPNGANSVVRVEYTEESNGYMTIKNKDYDNIAYKGENLNKGDVILRRGTLIKAQHIGILSAFGLSEIEIAKQPLIGIVTTGSELVKPGEVIKEGQIYNSNAPQLIAQTETINVKSRYFGTVSDKLSETIDLLDTAISESDVLLISGGVSKGDYDYVPKALDELNVNIKFRKWLVKPGFPTVFGKKGDKYIFGLPGNPVSTFVIFEIFVKPLIFKMMGHNYIPDIVEGKLSENFTRRNSERVEFRPIIIENSIINQLKYYGSGHINVLAQANGLMRIERGVNKLSKGERLSVRRI